MSEDEFHSQLHKHRTCSQLDGTRLRWPDTNRGFLTLGGATQLLQDQQCCTPDPHSYSDSVRVCCPLLGCQTTTLIRVCCCCFKLKQGRQNSPTCKQTNNTNTADRQRKLLTRGGEPTPAADRRRLNRKSNMIKAQRTIAQQCFVKTRGRKVLRGNTHLTLTRGNVKTVPQHSS